MCGVPELLSQLLQDIATIKVIFKNNNNAGNITKKLLKKKFSYHH